jgi:hypothetical protein
VEGAPGDGLDTPRDAEPVELAERQGLEDEEVERALQEGSGLSSHDCIGLVSVLLGGRQSRLV